MISRCLPQMIIVLGPPAAGKSSFICRLKTCYRSYDIIDDLQLLREIFLIDSFVYQINKCHNSEIQSNLLCKYRKLGNKLQYARRIWKGYLEKMKKNKYIEPKYSIPRRNGGYKIIDPNIRDEILRMAVNNLKLNHKYVLEFARGSDKEYLITKGISETQVYLRSLQLIESLLPFLLKNSILIIHITASYKVRGRRNKNRRLVDRLCINREMMEQIYSRDIFKFTRNNPGSNKGWVELSKPICVYSIDNNAHLLANELGSFFGKELHRALDFFESFSQT